jgi:hypothetical protein
MNPCPDTNQYRIVEAEGLMAMSQIEMPLLLLTVKQHPHGKILRNILETMGNMRGTEQHVARTNCGYRFLDSIMATSGGDEIEFIALMRNLRSVGGASGESDLKITVNEHFGRSPWCPWQSERGGERHWVWRAIHGSPSRQGNKNCTSCGNFKLRHFRINEF